MNDATLSTASVLRLAGWAIDALQETECLDTTDINALRLLERIANDIVALRWSDALKSAAATEAAHGTPAYPGLSLQAKDAVRLYREADDDAMRIRTSVGYRIGK